MGKLGDAWGSRKENNMPPLPIQSAHSAPNISNVKFSKNFQSDKALKIIKIWERNWKRQAFNRMKPNEGEKKVKYFL